ncbi:uncharacterized protein [Prorops nasuta]|uniref:uncharacterized protein n=1 Tax=Prorops nasuta TaxID=863751 RepID=UPI0034CD3837
MKSKEEIDCEDHFIKHVQRDDHGRYIVRLPFRDNRATLGFSYNIAVKRLLNLEKKFTVNNDLKTRYSEILEEYINLNHMSVVANDKVEQGYVMPHHAIHKDTSNTTKMRFVFDASAKSDNGVSLNDVLMIGPVIQPKLFSHLIRFRTYNVSPFLAIRTLHKLAEDEQETFPRASEILTSHLYVDDLLTGTETIEDAQAIRIEITQLLQRSEFNIRQWAAMNNEL